MKIKLSNSEFEVLYQLLAIVIDIKASGIEGNLIHAVLLRLYLKFYRKRAVTANRYTVKLESDEACAFYMYTTKLQVKEVFTSNLLTQINFEIHKKYSV